MEIVICEDNLQDQYNQVTALSDIIKKNGIPAVPFEVFDSGIDLLSDWQMNDESILFLDIHMPEMDGIEVANIIREKGYRGEVVFLTVSKNHVLYAFDVEALNYLVKGEVDQEKTEKVFLEAYQRVKEKNRKYITLNRGGDVRNISIDSISYFELKNRIVTVHYDDETFSFYSTMEKIESMVKEEQFVRIHRAYIVGITNIKKIQKKDICLTDGTVLPLSPVYANRNANIFKGDR